MITKSPAEREQMLKERVAEMRRLLKAHQSLRSGDDGFESFMDWGEMAIRETMRRAENELAAMGVPPDVMGEGK